MPSIFASGQSRRVLERRLDVLAFPLEAHLWLRRFLRLPFGLRTCEHPFAFTRMSWGGSAASNGGYSDDVSPGIYINAAFNPSGVAGVAPEVVRMLLVAS